MELFGLPLINYIDDFGFSLPDALSRMGLRISGAVGGLVGVIMWGKT